jgi:DNA-binding CsgD family transcriptional regulator
MVEFIVYFVFIISVAFAAGGIILSNRLRTVYKYDFFTNLMYYLIFIYTFGFYGIWGQVIISFFLKDYLSDEALVRISDIAILLGLPFVVFAWMMLIRFSRLLSGKENRDRFIIWFLGFNFSVIILLGFIITKNPYIETVTLLKYYFITFNFIYCILSSLTLYTAKKRNSVSILVNRNIISTVPVLIMILQNFLLYFYKSETYLALFFIIVFFTGNSFLPLYLSYGANYVEASKETLNNLTIDQFWIKYDISPREKEIITEICNGLSNKEIADRLFITLQTVKDHTHRIYIKTNVKSRVNLINLVREIAKP